MQTRKRTGSFPTLLTLLLASLFLLAQQAAAVEREFETGTDLSRLLGANQDIAMARVEPGLSVGNENIRLSVSASMYSTSTAIVSL